jgi:hypothetical protein
MDLKTFVAETLCQIMEGVAEAQVRAKERGGVVNPFLKPTEHLPKNGILSTFGGPAQLVEFDVAVAATEGSGTKGGIGIVIGAVTLGSAGQSQAEKSASSRVKFVVPVSLPTAER